MSVFDIITLLGGLAMFLYGMRLMGDSLKAGSTGTLKKILEHLTDNPFKAFVLGLVITAVIQSSTATIVLTAGLVGAGILKLKQTLGIIVGANVGTTVTGQIIRLLDVDDSSVSWLRIFKPSTLAPIALVIGIVFIMFVKRMKNSNTIGNIAMGFGVLFSGLLNMTGAVDSLTETGAFNKMFESLSESPFIGYFIGVAVSFILQSSSATIGILQAFSMSGMLPFKAIYAVILGIYLGDCVTTAIVCSIGAKADAKRVGIVNILFNLSETVVVLLVVTLLHQFGVLDSLWGKPVTPGIIANTNTIFNMGCAIVLFPMLGLYEKASRKIVRNDKVPKNKYQDRIDALNPKFASSPALALRSCYDALYTMFTAARNNINAAFRQLHNYDRKMADEIEAEEDNIDLLTDCVSQYLIEISPSIKEPYQTRIIDQYYKVVTEYERLGDHADNISELATEMHDKGYSFSQTALDELSILESLIDRILGHTELAFGKRSEEDAIHIEPLEEVVDDMINSLKDYHIARLRDGKCNVYAGTYFLNLLSDVERISDHCSNIGVETIARINADLGAHAHNYISSLHSGHDERFNREYNAAHDEFFQKLEEQRKKEQASKEQE